MATEVILPRVDMDMTVGKIGQWLFDEGASVEKGQPLFVIETDKAAMEIEAPASGVLRGVSARLGDELPVGSVVGWICAPGEAYERRNVSTKVGDAEPISTATERSRTAPPTETLSSESSTGLRATPMARRLAREQGVVLNGITGTGPAGRIGGDDVRSFVRTARAAPSLVSGSGSRAEAGAGVNPQPAVDFGKYGPVEQENLSRIKVISGSKLARSWATIPHVTNFDRADVTELEAFRKAVNAEHEAYGLKTTMLAFLIMAVVSTLKRFKTFNASLVGDVLVLKNYFHVGFATDTPRGLLVPVLRDANRKGILEIAAETAALARRARNGELKPEDMAGGCFSISSLGGIGGTGFTPIINAPEVAILGVSKASTEPVWDGVQFRPRLMLPLSLSWDHRAVDGVEAARFLVHVAAILSDYRRLLL